jgi:hypothetical protein
LSAELTRPPDDVATTTHAPPGGLSLSAPTTSPQEASTHALGSLPLGARIILRCRKDWRTATVAAFEPDLARVVLSVASPSGHTYRVRRPADSPLTLDGHIPILGEGSWRPGLVRYDLRW